MFTLTTPLTKLETADLIRRLRDPSLHSGEDTYQFKHNLIQESAYSSLLKNDRRALHRACAEALERAYPHALDEHAALLAKHFAEAGNDAKTFEYARRAGEAAFRVHALAEALMHYDTASSLAPRLQIPVDDFLRLHQQRGRVLEVMGRFDEAVDAYRALEQLGKTRNEPQLELGALLSLATLFTFPNNAQNLDEALRVNQAALKLARETHDEASEARALWNMQQHAYFTGHATKAIAYSKQALEIADRLNLRELRAYILNDVSRALVTAVSAPSALDALAQARTIWRELNNLPMLVDNLSSTSEAAQACGEVEMAIEFGKQAQELSQTIGNVWNLAYSSGNLMTIYVQTGETRKALDLYAPIVRLGKQSGFSIAAQIADIQLAALYGYLGEPSRGVELLSKPAANDSFMFLEAWRMGAMSLLEMACGNLAAARAAVERARVVVATDDLSTYGPIFVGLCGAELALHEKRYDDARDEAQTIVEKLRALGMKIYLSDLLLRLAQAHLGLREIDAAQNILREAEQVARHTQARFVLWEILVASSHIEATRGNLERARALKQEAREIIGWLAEYAPSEFRESFFAQEKVRAVVST